MARPAVAGELEQVEMADQVGPDIGVRIVERVADARLRGEMDDAVEFERRSSAPLSAASSAKSTSSKREASPCRAQSRRPVPLQRGRVIIVEIVDADDAVAAAEQARGDMIADEAGGAGDEQGHEAPNRCC